MNIREFDGDPMVQLETFESIDDKIFYLNQDSVNEIYSYSQPINVSIGHGGNAVTSVNLPAYIVQNIDVFSPKYKFVFTKGGIDEEGKQFPDTYIGLEQIWDKEELGITDKIQCIYADDIQYVAPQTGEEILLKKNLVKGKTL